MGVVMDSWSDTKMVVGQMEDVDGEEALEKCQGKVAREEAQEGVGTVLGNTAANWQLDESLGLEDASARIGEQNQEAQHEQSD